MRERAVPQCYAGQAAGQVQGIQRWKWGVWERDWERLVKQTECPQPRRGKQKTSEVFGPRGHHLTWLELKRMLVFRVGRTEAKVDRPRMSSQGVWAEFLR